MNDLLRYQIGLTLIKGIGPVNARKLISYLGSVEAIFCEKKDILKKVPGIGEVLAAEISTQQVLKRADKEIEFIQKHHIKTHYFADASYPYRLKECDDAPILLYSTGNCDFNSGHFVAIVGTRKITPYGKDICHELVQTLAETQQHITIVSGLAYGTDICAHKSALENQIPTIGVVAHGLDRIYPSAHTSIAKKMVANGAVITEYLSETNPDAPNFVERNRIVAGLCDAVIIIESPKRGGSLITAQIANDYNRDVFAFPGKVSDIYSEGCNQLIRTNRAALITCGKDLIDFMGWDVAQNKPQQQILFNELNPDEQKIIETINKAGTIYINILAKETDISLQKLLALLVQLEFKGLIKALPGSMYKCA
ncbi:MAG: DNA-protecting protein DprA [Sphingobacteriia bacterium]|jgi:DNA processing protein|nr:DNA-processing protein DprA [Paludibacteraceae bacterium]NCA80484.1 DNA-protecting protein DprA [Sphingobacteriia bacterium]